MAITKIIKIKSNTKACIKYVVNDKKTNEGLYVTYNGCQAETIVQSFNAALTMNKRHNANSNSVKAYHFIQSFSKTDDISPEEANKIGMEMMDRLFAGKYAFACATHIDKGHMHNHIVMCAAERAMTGNKVNDNLTLLHKLQKTNDDLCREYGYDVIDKKRGKGKHYREWQEDLTNPKGSKKSQLRDLIDEQIKFSNSFDNFIENMKAVGAEISFGNSKKYGKVTKYKLPDSGPNDKWHRGYNLGAGYSDEMIAKRIDRRLRFIEDQNARNAERSEARRIERASMSKADKAIDRTKLKIKNIVDTSTMETTSSNYNKIKWYDKQNAMRAEQIKTDLHNNFGIDYTQLKNKINELIADNNHYSADIAANKKSVETLRALIENCTLYSQSYRTNINYNKSKNQERYYEEHDSELDAFAEAEDFLKRAAVKLDVLQDKENAKKYIAILQGRLNSADETRAVLEEKIRENERTVSELRKYQKELEVYHGR